ncbi:hypothetical protein B0H17DRAFT_1260665, partial [Mycena rosella]
LGDTFVLTNPRLPDHPIVLVSGGFVNVTGYPQSADNWAELPILAGARDAAGVRSAFGTG